MTTTANRPALQALLAAIRDRLEVIAPDIPIDLRGLLTGTIGPLEHAVPGQLGPILLELSLEIHGIVEALLYRSTRRIEEQRAAMIDLARRIERIGTAARWAYVVIAGGELRAGADPTEAIARAARDELQPGEPVEGITERLMREWGEEQRAETAALAAPPEAS